MSIQEMGGKLVSSEVDFIYKIGTMEYFHIIPKNCTEIGFEEWRKRFNKILEHEMDIQSLWFCKTVICGLHSGFPLCCVLNYVAGNYLFQAELFGDKFYLFEDGDVGVNEFSLEYYTNEFEFVLCPKCLDLFIDGKLNHKKFNFKNCNCWHGSSNDYLSKPISRSVE